MGISARQKAHRQQKRSLKKKAVERTVQQRKTQDKQLVQLHESDIRKRPEYKQKKEVDPLDLADGMGVYIQHWTDYDLYLSRFLELDGFTDFCKENVSMLAIWGRLGYEKRGKGILVAPGLTANNGELRYHILFCYVTKNDLDNLDYLYPEVKSTISDWIDSYDPMRDVRLLIQRKKIFGEVKTRIVDEDWEDYAQFYINDKNEFTLLNFNRTIAEDTPTALDGLVAETKEHGYPFFFLITPPEFRVNISDYVCVTPENKIPKNILKTQIITKVVVD